MRKDRDPKTGQFIKGHRGGPGRPPAGEPTKADLKRQRAIIAAWRVEAGGVDLIGHMHATLHGPACKHCDKPLSLTAWRTPRRFCSAACADLAERRRLVGQRRRNARSKLSRGIRPWPCELAALDEGG